MAESNTETLSETPVEAMKKPATVKIYKRHLYPLAVIVILAYIVTTVLANKGRMKKITHKKIWNTVLLISCAVSCLIGMLLEILSEGGVMMDVSIRSLLVMLHVDLGVVMTLVAIFHIFWHMKYWKNLFRKTKAQ